MSISGISNLNALVRIVHPGKIVNPAAPTERQTATQGGKDLPQLAQDEPGKISLTQALRKILDYMPNLSTDLEFHVSESAHRAVITVLDSKTNEVVRQIPSEEVIAIAQYIADSASEPLSGLLLDGKG